MYLQVPGCYQVENIIANCHYSIHIQFYFKICNFFLKWHILITYSRDGYCRFRVTLGISLTMSNKKWFFDFLHLKILQAITLKILVRNLEPKCICLLQLEKVSTIYSKPDPCLCFDCDTRPLRCVFVQLSSVPSPHGINEAGACYHHWFIGSTHTRSH